LSTREHSGLVVAEEQVNKRVHLNGIRMQWKWHTSAIGQPWCCRKCRWWTRSGRISTWGASTRVAQEYLRVRAAAKIEAWKSRGRTGEDICGHCIWAESERHLKAGWSGVKPVSQAALHQQRWPGAKVKETVSTAKPAGGAKFTGRQVCGWRQSIEQDVVS
jgi:hypothetical protein